MQSYLVTTDQGCRLSKLNSKTSLPKALLRAASFSASSQSACLEQLAQWFACTLPAQLLSGAPHIP
jgi:hypothetical protein